MYNIQDNNKHYFFRKNNELLKKNDLYIILGQNY